VQYRIGVFFLVIIVTTSIILLQYNQDENDLNLLLDKSGPYIGVNFPKNLGYNGEGITIAVIDTGIDHRHPDLFGFGPDGKVVQGYNYVENDKMAIDTNGHGTEVAGIIAADGQLSGIAPKSSLISYKVSKDGDSVSSDLIVKAIEQAIIDDVDIINISLGVNRTNSKIDDTVNKAIQEGIVVVVAAGNDGPESNTIGSPGINPNPITVGATYNNITSSLVATLEVEEKQFQILPMVGIEALDEPVKAEILFGSFGREGDLSENDFTNSIILVERGSDIEGEIVYFSDKEKNAANAGAKAIVVYNNEPGIFLGELLHQFAPEDYQPRIPTISMSREDGLVLKEMAQNRTVGTLHVFYNPDFVAHFSSRGPISPFYIKPDLVAPGAFVNTTLTDGKYNFTSGTSFAAPHVTGAAAILLQKNPNLLPNEIKSLLVTTTDSVSDAYGNQFSLNAAGSGRLNVTRAFEGNLIITPPYLTFYLSPENPFHKQTLQLDPINGGLEDIKIKFEGPEFVEFNYQLNGETLDITSSLEDVFFEKFEGKMIIQHDGTSYNVPMIGQITKGAVSVLEQDGKLNFVISHPDEWSYAKISLINKETGKWDTVSATPSKEASILVFKNGEYWVEANIEVDGETFDAYETIKVRTASLDSNPNPFALLEIPERPIIIIFAIAILIALVGLKIRR